MITRPELNPIKAEFKRDPHSVLDYYLLNEPVFRHDIGGAGVVSIFGYDDIKELCHQNSKAIAFERTDFQNMGVWEFNHSFKTRPAIHRQGASSTPNS